MLQHEKSYVNLTNTLLTDNKEWVRHLTFSFQLVLISWTVTLSSCLIWQIISFILPPNEYGCVYAWTSLRDRLTEDADFGKEIILSDEAHFDHVGYVNNQKLLHLGHRKPTSIHWKAKAPKTSHCLVRILAQRHNWFVFLRKWARRGRYSQWWSLLGHVEWTACNKTALRATQPKLHSMFCVLFLKIA